MSDLARRNLQQGGGPGHCPGLFADPGRQRQGADGIYRPRPPRRSSCHDAFLRTGVTGGAWRFAIYGKIISISLRGHCDAEAIQEEDKQLLEDKDVDAVPEKSPRRITGMR